MQILKRHGVAPSRCAKLVATFGADVICDTVESLESQMKSGKRNASENPAGFIIYSLENELPVPAEFLTTRRREQMKQASKREQNKKQRGRCTCHTCDGLMHSMNNS